MLWVVRVSGVLFIALVIVLGLAVYKNAPQEYQILQWQDLIAKDAIQPEFLFSNMNLSAISDADPMAEEMLQAILAEWANAPVNDALNDSMVTISGYVVPLDWSDSRSLSEFLLVPYFGACIHSPPPPANQIIHIQLVQPVQNIHSMSEVSISGRLIIQRNDAAAMGVSSYTMLLDEIERYQ